MQDHNRGMKRSSGTLASKTCSRGVSTASIAASTSASGAMPGHVARASRNLPRRRPTVACVARWRPRQSWRNAV